MVQRKMLHFMNYKIVICKGDPGTSYDVFQSRNFYVQRVTPKYFVGRRAGRVPAEFTVDILPFNSWSWGVVQNIAQNPRIR